MTAALDLADVEDDALVEEVIRRCPGAAIPGELVLRGFDAARRRRSLEPPSGGFYSLAQLAPLFPGSRGRPRSTRSLAQWCESGRFGIPGSEGGPRKNGARWMVPHEAALAALGSKSVPDAAAPEPVAPVRGVHPIRTRTAAVGPLSEALRACDV